MTDAVPQPGDHHARPTTHPTNDQGETGMTTNDIAAIRRRLNRATLGPWALDYKNDTERQVLRVVAADRVIAEVPMDPGCLVNDWRDDAEFNNAEFIAAARIFVPALCDEVEQLRARLAESRKGAAALANEVLSVQVLLMSADGDPLDDAEEIPVGEIRRVMSEAREEMCRDR